MRGGTHIALLELHVWIDSLGSFVDFVTELRKWHAFAGSYTFKHPENPFAKTKATGRRHAIFQHFNVIYIEHHCFVITSITHLLLINKPIQLIDWIIKLREQ